MTQRPSPRILSIAGSDSSGGAGIQADIKTIAMLGGYAMTAITAVTAQNTVGVQGIAPMGGEIVARQVTSCIEDIGVDAIKIGMLHDGEIIDAVATSLEGVDVPIVLDPVMIATSGAALISQDAIALMRERLFPRATLVTPNLPELEHLAGRTLRSSTEITDALEQLVADYDTAVLAKGGHTEDARIIDFLGMPGKATISFESQRIDTPHTHGTGCTLSSAIATLLGHGQPLGHAVDLGRQFVRAAIEGAPGFGSGNGPLGHHAVRSLQSRS